MDEVREKMEKLVARTSSSLGSRIDRVRKDGAQNKDDIAAVRFEVSRAKANSRQDVYKGVHQVVHCTKLRVVSNIKML